MHGGDEVGNFGLAAGPYGWKCSGDHRHDGAVDLGDGHLQQKPCADGRGYIGREFEHTIVGDRAHQLNARLIKESDGLGRAEIDRTGGPVGEDHRVAFSLLHHNRHLYRFETRSAGSALGFTKIWQVGATKEGVPFAEVPKGPECVVSGGVGTMKVSFKGKDYFVCCSGCRDAFKDNPEKWIKEFEARANEKK